MRTPPHVSLSRRDVLKLGAGSATSMVLPAVVAEAQGNPAGARAPVTADVALSTPESAHDLLSRLSLPRSPGWPAGRGRGQAAASAPARRPVPAHRPPR